MSFIRRSPYLLVLMFGICIAARAQAQVLTNRTPDAAKVNSATPSAQQLPTPAPASIYADPALFRPGEGPKVVEEPLDPAYFVCLRNVTHVLVADSHGQVDDLFNSRSAHTVRSATYHFVDSDAVYIIVPVKEAYSITFETNEPVMFLEILKGRSNSSPDEAIRYRDLDLDGRRAKFELSPGGPGSLRWDKSAAGQFDSVIEPTVNLRGLAAHDTTRPHITFQVLDRTGDTVLVAIKAEDAESGVKRLSYALDNISDSHGGYRNFSYQGPVRIDLKQTKLLWAFAEDYAANRSGAIYDFRK